MDLVLTGTSKLLGLAALKNRPAGFKGFDELRAALRIADKLELDVTSDKAPTKEDLDKEYSLSLSKEELLLLRRCVEETPWKGDVLKQAVKLVDQLFDIQDD